MTCRRWAGGPTASCDGGTADGWTDVATDGGPVTVESDAYRVTADPARGGTLTSVDDRRGDRELLTGPGNELRVYEEYAAHPRFSEGPWHLLPNGRSVHAADTEARVLLQESAIGRRLVARGVVDGIEYEQVTTLVDGLDRVELTTRFLDHEVSDRLVRVRFPVDQPGGLPVSEVASGWSAAGSDSSTPTPPTPRGPWTTRPTPGSASARRWRSTSSTSPASASVRAPSRSPRWSSPTTAIRPTPATSSSPWPAAA